MARSCTLFPLCISPHISADFACCVDFCKRNRFNIEVTDLWLVFQQSAFARQNTSFRRQSVLFAKIQLDVMDLCVWRYISLPCGNGALLQNTAKMLPGVEQSCRQRDQLCERQWRGNLPQLVQLLSWWRVRNSSETMRPTANKHRLACLSCTDLLLVPELSHCLSVGD